MSKWLKAAPTGTAKNPVGQSTAEEANESKAPKDELAPTDPERTMAPPGDKHSEDDQEGEGDLKKYLGKPNTDYPSHSNPSCSSEEY